MRYWLMKSEPSTYGIDQLAAARRKTDHWDGVRNYQARNFMREMKVGDQAFFYHSNCAEPGVVGIVEIAREHYPDFTAFDPKSSYYDAKSSLDNPRWYMVDVRFVRKMKETIPLSEIKQNLLLKELRLVRRGNRLSVMPVTAKEWKAILIMEKS
jgi:predicted RNA-binding protein with PUA-like domain